ncbi:unnamed protein product [Prunus brigantina]
MMACVGLHPEVSTLNVVINCLCRMNQVDLGFSVLATILKHGLQPNAYTSNTLLHGICKYRSLSEAMELFQKIEEQGLACCEITYATIINGLCRAGKTCMALEILEQMYEDGRFKPDPQCYNPIIDRLCKERRIDEALTLFRDMINKGIAPNVISYNSLIYGLCNMGLWTRALALFEIMKNKGIKPDVVTFNSIIGAACKSGNSVLDALCKEGKTAEALNLVEEMFLRGVKPDLVTYNSLINSLCHSSQWKEATRLFNRMLDEGIAPDVVTLTTVIHALCKERRVEEALSVLELMSQRGMRLNIFTYSSLIYGMCRTNQWAEATRLFDEMAKKVIDLMVIKDNVPDIASCYKALVNGYMQAKRIGEALRLVEEMIEQGVMPDLETLKALRDLRPKRHVVSAEYIEHVGCPLLLLLGLLLRSLQQLVFCQPKHLLLKHQAFVSLMEVALHRNIELKALPSFDVFDSGQNYRSVPSFKHLQPGGDSYTRRSAFDSILAGCIPVFFHPGTAYSQYLWHLPKNHSSYSVFIPVREAKDVPASIEEILLGISEDKEFAMREEVIRLIPNLVYADPRSRLETADAFDLAVKGILERIEDVREVIREGKDPSIGFADEDSYKYTFPQTQEQA